MDNESIGFNKGVEAARKYIYDVLVKMDNDGNPVAEVDELLLSVCSDLETLKVKT